MKYRHPNNVCQNQSAIIYGRELSGRLVRLFPVNDSQVSGRIVDWVPESSVSNPSRKSSANNDASIISKALVWLSAIFKSIPQNWDLISYGKYNGRLIELVPVVGYNKKESGFDITEIIEWTLDPRKTKEVDTELEMGMCLSNDDTIRFCKSHSLEDDSICEDTDLFVDVEERLRCSEFLLDVNKIKFCKSLAAFDYDRILVDSNVFMDAASKENTNYKSANVFFDIIQRCKLEINIVTSQLNELNNMKRHDDSVKRLKARGAQRKIEELQDIGLLSVLDDITKKTCYADPEIIDVARQLMKEGHKPLVITGDRDLRIKLRAVNALSKSLLELFSAPITPLHIRGVHCGNKFVCMDMERGEELVANRECADLWESFSLFVDNQCFCSFQSDANKKFIRANAESDGILVASERSSNELEPFKFSFIPVKGSRPRFAFKSVATGKYVSIREDDGNILKANVASIGDWEIFEFC